MLLFNAEDVEVDVFLISDLLVDVDVDIKSDVRQAEVADDDFDWTVEFLSLFDAEVFFVIVVVAFSKLLSSLPEAAILLAAELDRRVVEPVLFN